MTPKSSSVINEGYALLAECVAADTIPVRKYRSSRTGLTVIAAQVPGPVVSGCFSVATEATDDDGLPHTLEHLIFLGSTDYPYKGTLDLFANRCLADGTNAWTDIDHTAYTVSTAGSDGFLALLPIYLDHLFFPTLTDAGFTTEVYHITGEGKDSGVVFCECQGIETNDETILFQESLRALYKRPCGYRSDTGGAVCNLRYSTNNEKIRAFHKKFYCPLNTTIIVAGCVDDAKLLDVVYKFEEKLIRTGSNVYDKAWQTPVEVLEKSTIRAVTYPCDQEDTGHAIISWQGPSVVTEYYQLVASTILFTYLTESAASPLMKFFVETSDPYCSNISVSVIENSVPSFSFMFENVVIDRIPVIHEKLINLLKLIADNSDQDYNINTTRMVSVIEKFALKELLKFEKEPQYSISKILIHDTLYGQSVKDMSDKLNLHKLAEKMLKEPVSFWFSLLNKYFINGPSATVLGYPWKNEQVVSTQLESDRVAYRKKTYGDIGLKQKGEELQKAIAQNEVQPPNELIATVPVPRTDNLCFHSVNRYTVETEKQHPDFDISSSPVYTHLDDVESKFVYAYVLMDCKQLPKKSSLFLPLLLEYLISCPIDRNGQIISHEQVASELEKDLITIKSCVGLFSNDIFATGQYCSWVTLSLVMTQENFEKGIDWIRTLLYSSVFTCDRLKVVAQKLISRISQYRRQGPFIIKCLAKLMAFDAANYQLTTVLSQLEFLNDLCKKLENEAELKTIISSLEDIRAILVEPGNITLHLSTNVGQLVTKHKNPANCLSRLLPENAILNRQKIQIRHDNQFLSPSILKGSGDVKSCVVGMATEDSSFMFHSTKSITDFNHPDLPALLVYIEYLTQLEGPLWRNIRGLGLSYGYSIQLNPNEGILYLTFYRSSDIVQAFCKTKEIVAESASNPKEWNYLLFESAKSSLIFKIVALEKNISNVSRQSLLEYFHGTSADYNRVFINKIQDVRIEDMKRIADLYINPLFDPSTSLSAIVCHSSKYEDVASGFAQMGHDLVAFPSLEESYLSHTFIMSQYS